MDPSIMENDPWSSLLLKLIVIPIAVFGFVAVISQVSFGMVVVATHRLCT